jgi:hypothetical protein
LPGGWAGTKVGGVTPDGKPGEIDPVVRDHVESVLRHLLLPGELEHWELGWKLVGGSWALVADVVACGEPYFGFIGDRDAPAPIEDGLDVFTDGFEDFISESRFAWGQRRELQPRPWRS